MSSRPLSPCGFSSTMSVMAKTRLVGTVWVAEPDVPAVTVVGICNASGPVVAAAPAGFLDGDGAADGDLFACDWALLALLCALSAFLSAVSAFCDTWASGLATAFLAAGVTPGLTSRNQPAASSTASATRAAAILPLDRGRIGSCNVAASTWIGCWFSGVTSTWNGRVTGGPVQWRLRLRTETVVNMA